MFSVKNKEEVAVKPVVEVFLTDDVSNIKHLKVSKYCISAVRDPINPVRWIIIPNELTYELILDTHILVLTPIKLHGGIPAISVNIFINGKSRLSSIEDVVNHLNSDGRYIAMLAEDVKE